MKKILDRMEVPPFDQTPDLDAMTKSSAKRWRPPDSEINIVLVETGPQSGARAGPLPQVARLSDPHAPNRLPQRRNPSIRPVSATPLPVLG